MANDKNFKVKNGLSAKRYLQSGSALGYSDVDMSSGSYFTKTLSANTTLTFSNPPPSGSAGSFALEVTGADVAISGDLANASYDGIQFDVSGRETSPNGVEFKPDGTKMYIVGAAGDDITEYTLSPAWDITSATYVTDYSVSGQQVNPRCVRFKSDGTAMYVSNSSNASITTYTLSTPWSVSSVSSNSTTTLSGGASTLEFWFKSDGTRIFGLSGASVFSYTLSTAWDVSSATADTGSLTVPSSHSIALTSDGAKLFTSQETGSAGIIHEFSMTTPYDITTGSATGVTFDVSSQDIRPYGITLKPDDTKLYMIGNNDDLSQYSITGSTPATITYPSSVKWSGATTPDAPAAGEKDVYVFVTTDGGGTYYGKQAGDAVA